jgi:hypothetical protein
MKVEETTTMSTAIPLADVSGQRSCLDLAPKEVKDFVVARDLASDAEYAEELARKLFPEGSTASFEVARDRESDAEWLVLRVTLTADPDTVLQCYSKFLEDWIASASPRATKHITLSYAIV